MTPPEPLLDPVEADAFDLPEWLAEGDVVWTARSSSRGVARAAGELRPLPSRGDGSSDREHPSLACDLLAVDHAHPQALVAEDWRRRAHSDWARGEVLLLTAAGDGTGVRLVLAVPGYVFDADLVLEALGRLARAVGVRRETFRALLRP